MMALMNVVQIVRLQSDTSRMTPTGKFALLPMFLLSLMVVVVVMVVDIMFVVVLVVLYTSTSTNKFYCKNVFAGYQ